MTPKPEPQDDLTPDTNAMLAEKFLDDRWRDRQARMMLRVYGTRLARALLRSRRDLAKAEAVVAAAQNFIHAADENTDNRPGLITMRLERYRISRDQLREAVAALASKARGGETE